MADEKKSWKDVAERAQEGKAALSKKVREGQEALAELRLLPVQRALVDSGENFGGGFLAKLTDNIFGDMLPEWAPPGLVVGGVSRAWARSEMERKAKEGEAPGMEQDIDALAAGMFGGEGYALATKVSDGLMSMFEAS